MVYKSLHNQGLHICNTLIIR